MKKSIMLLVGGLALLAGFGNLVGCGNQGAKPAPAEPKWKGLPYRLTFDTQPDKPKPGSIIIPPVKFTANPDATENRAILVIQFEASGRTTKEPVEKRLIGTATDIRGTEGTLSPDYMAQASKGLSDYLGDHCLTGSVKVSVALARSSLKPTAEDPEIDALRISDWLPTTLDFKNPHPKCK